MKKYTFSRAKWYDTVHVGSSVEDREEIFNWCVEVFGKPDSVPNAWSRWAYSSMQWTPRFRFRDEKDYVAFTLRWS